MRKLLSNKRGFTLVEILVVILIIGILFVAFLPKIDFAGDKARETGVKSSLRTYMIANEQLFREYAGFKGAETTTEMIHTDNTDEINKLLDASTRIKTPGSAPDGVLQDGANKVGFTTNEEDPWKKPYEVSFHKATAGTGRSIVVSSFGKNQTANTADFVLVTTYKDGTIKSCTYGLNNNIGVVTTQAAVDTPITGTGVAASTFGTLWCK